MPMFFEWDEQKEKINIAKHKISFKTAELVFKDDNRIEWYDEKYSTPDEDRYITIGNVGNMTLILVVVYTPRGKNEERIRLISARKATRSEKEEYLNDHHTYC